MKTAQINFVYCVMKFLFVLVFSFKCYSQDYFDGYWLKTYDHDSIIEHIDVTPIWNDSLKRKDFVGNVVSFSISKNKEKRNRYYVYSPKDGLIVFRDEFGNDFDSLILIEKSAKTIILQQDSCIYKYDRLTKREWKTYCQSRNAQSHAAGDDVNK